MTYLKNFENLTVKEQSSKITELVTEFFLLAIVNMIIDKSVQDKSWNKVPWV